MRNHTTHAHPAPFDPLIDSLTFRAELGVSEATFYRLRKAKHIPDPVDLPGVPRWRHSTVEAVKGRTRSAGRGNAIPVFGTEPAALARAAQALPPAAYDEFVTKLIGL